MLRQYANVIQKIFEGIRSGQGSNLSFAEYAAVIGMGIGIVLIFAAIIAVLSGTVWLPKLIFKKIFAKWDAMLEQMRDDFQSALMAGNNQNAKEIGANISRTEKSIMWKKVAIVTVTIAVYLPVAIPTVLFVLDSIISIA